MKIVDDKLNDKHPRPALEAMDAVEIAAKSLGFHGVKAFENDMNVRKCRAAVFQETIERRVRLLSKCLGLFWSESEND